MRARDLLDDAGCSLCAALAREVEALSEGRLQVRSLREPEVQARLDRARPLGLTTRTVEPRMANLLQKLGVVS